VDLEGIIARWMKSSDEAADDSEATSRDKEEEAKEADSEEVEEDDIGIPSIINVSNST